MPAGIKGFQIGHEVNVRHGKTKSSSQSPEYRSWAHMKQRCLNDQNDSFNEYGKAGIQVCDRWLIFENFLSDMGERPKGTTLDRIDGSKGYEPSNCRWASRQRQILNQKLRSTNKTGIKGICWCEPKQYWDVCVKRGYKAVLRKATRDFFEACCLVKSFEAKEKASATAND